MGDLNPAPRIRARPCPVSTADSTFSAILGLLPVFDCVSVLVAELARRRSLDREREPSVDSAKACDMKLDLCEGVPGVPGLVIAGLLACMRAISAAASAAVGVVAPLLPERSVAPVIDLSVVGRPLLLPPAFEDVSVPAAFALPFFDLLASGWMLSSLRVWMGISATPIITEVAVPINAPAAPETGSQGPSSGTYSRGRYLLTLANSP
jgi:hypothetical protein